MKCAVAVTHELDNAKEAARELARAIPAEFSGKGNSLGILFCDADMDGAAVTGELKELLGMDIAGMTTLAEFAPQGRLESGARTENVRLYPMKYSGCIGCYACKQRGAPSSLCQLGDALSPVLEMAQEADVLLLGTPVYFFTESAGTRAFIERLLYPWSAFNADGYGSRRPKPMVAGLFYTLAGTEESVPAHGHSHFKDSTDQFFSLHFIHHEVLLAYETLHTDNYDKLELGTFDAGARHKARAGRFAKDCERAGAIGAALARRVLP